MVSLTVHPEKCSGCRICEMACSMTHLGGFSPRKALVRVEINRFLRSGVETSRIDVPTICLQCDPAPCSEVCPEGAIERVESGAWVVDQGKCTGCRLCVEACPHGMIFIDSEKGIARKCDLCLGNPVCVRYCPMEALAF